MNSNLGSFRTSFRKFGKRFHPKTALRKQELSLHFLILFNSKISLQEPKPLQQEPSYKPSISKQPEIAQQMLQQKTLGRARIIILEDLFGLGLTKTSMLFALARDENYFVDPPTTTRHSAPMQLIEYDPVVLKNYCAKIHHGVVGR